jgi:hypothetical protein
MNILPKKLADDPENGDGAGKWFMMAIDPRTGARRAGYCASRCAGHATESEALEHHLQYLLDRESDLWLDRRGAPRDCEICGEPTTLMARLGRKVPLIALCQPHQSTNSLQIVHRRRNGLLPAVRPGAAAVEAPILEDESVEAAGPVTAAPAGTGAQASS